MVSVSAFLCVPASSYFSLSAHQSSLLLSETLLHIIAYLKRSAEPGQLLRTLIPEVVSRGVHFSLTFIQVSS